MYFELCSYIELCFYLALTVVMDYILHLNHRSSSRGVGMKDNTNISDQSNTDFSYFKSVIMGYVFGFVLAIILFHFFKQKTDSSEDSDGSGTMADGSTTHFSMGDQSHERFHTSRDDPVNEMGMEEQSDNNSEELTDFYDD